MIELRRKPSAHALTTAFLAASFALSVAILSARNLYDDEISSLWIVTGPVRSIVRFAATRDVHPPGMYLLAHAAWLATHSYRWMDLFPCVVLYAGLGTFLFAVTALIENARCRTLFLLLATLHPEFLLWSNTFRWYSWWTGLALIALTVSLQPPIERPGLTRRRSVALGVLLAALFYLNYITLLFAAALAVAMLLRYRAMPRRQRWDRLLLTSVAFALFSAPQIYTMICWQLDDVPGQRSGVVASAAHLVAGFALSEAYLPWHSLAIAAALCLALLTIVGAVRLLRATRQAAVLAPDDSAMQAIALFAATFFALVLLSGLGGKPRSAILLAPVVAPVAAIGAERLHRWAQYAILCLIAVWCAVGAAHMLTRSHLAKATMNDRPEEVVQFIREDARRGCAQVSTYDAGLAVSLAQARLPNTVVLAPRDDNRGVGMPPAQFAGCKSARIYLVRSYLADEDWAQMLGKEQSAAAQAIEGTAQVHNFSPDPDAARKRKLATLPLIGGDLADAARLPNSRFVVTSGEVDPSRLREVQQSLSDFVPQP